MEGWKEAPLEELVDVFLDYRGKTPPKTDEGVPLITAKIVKGGRIHKPTEFISEETYQTWMSRGYPQVNDVVLTVEAPLGEVALLKDNYAVPGQRIIMMRPKGAVLDSGYLKYFFQSATGQHALSSRASGTTVMGIKAAVLRKMPIPYPELSDQRAAAEVLSSLDDKIDLLHRQNATLEAVAKAIYRDAMTSSQGWIEVPLSDVTERITDGAHKSPPTFDEGMPMASVKDMTDWHIEIDGCRRISEADYAELVDMDCRPLKGDILIAKDGSYLKHVILAENDMDLVLLSSIAILRPNKSINPMLLAIWLKLSSTINDMQYIVSGTVIPRIVLKDFRKFPFPLPPKAAQEVLIERIKPLFEKCWANNREVATLSQMRDTLLPRLMSGAVRMDLGE